MESLEIRSNYLIIGAGIISLAVARELLSKEPNAVINIIDKEPDVAYHSSGRNSGVLHAGFYYSANSLKSKFTAEGNNAIREYCYTNKLRINESKKVVVVQNKEEIHTLYELYKSGKSNGVNVSIIDEKQLSEIEPNAKTYKKALYSPNTATVDPIEVCQALKTELLAKGAHFYFSECYIENLDNNSIKTSSDKIFCADKIINAAGLYADKIAKDFGFSKKYTIIPFKGIYLKYTKQDKPIKTNIYPVPNLKNPFLGVHYTVTVDNIVKIGPTAIPAFWRENYDGISKFKFNELLNILEYETKLFITNAFNFRSLALEEIKKYNKNYFISLAQKMVKKIDCSGFTEWSTPGIRAQLLNIETLDLVQDFVVEADSETIHILNAVSPAFTSSFPFAKWVVGNYILKN